jgi:hypothetical protein
MESHSKMIRIHNPNPHAKHVKGPRKHHGKKAPEGANGEVGIVTGRKKLQIPKRSELSKPNI